MVKGRILKTLTGVRVGKPEEILTGASPGGVEDAEDAVNGAGTNKVVAAGGPKGEDGV